MIVIDSREPDEIEEWIAHDADEMGYDPDVSVESLSTGDFLVNEFIIERKQYGDFIGRMTNSERDIWQQMLAMESAADELGYTPVLLLEGEYSDALNWSRITPKELTMAIGSIMLMDIWVVHVTGPRACAQLLIKLEDDSEHDIGSIRDSPSVPEELIPRYLTEGFPGVGPSRAEDLLERYGTFAELVRVIETDPDDLLEVSGIGDATRDKMVRYVTARWDA